MKLLAKLLRDAFDLWVGLLNLLGLRSSEWEWRKTRWRMSLEAKIASWEMTERGIRAPVRMCPACRELVDRNLSVCTACGASMVGVAGGGSKRLFAAILPHFSSLTSVLMTLNILMLALPLMIWGASPTAGIFSILSPSGKTMIFFGAKNYGWILETGQYWRLVTAGFLHFGIIHLAMNSYALTILGPLVEESFGWRKTLFVYIVCDIGAFGASLLFGPRAGVSAGASGPLFGLLGFAFVFARFRAGSRGRAVSQQLMGFITPAIVMLFLPGIDNAAHIGGFIAGAGLAMIMQDGEPRTPPARRLWSLLTLLTLAVLVGAFAMMVITYPDNVKLLTR